MDQVRCLNSKKAENYVAFHGDCVDVLRQIPDNSIGFSVYSPPFGSLFVYSESVADMGNSTDQEFAEHYAYLVREKFRITQPGRITAVHCSDLPMTKWKDGAVGIKDFSGQIIKIHEDAGWIMHSRRTIWKSPVTEMTRTKHVGLLYKQLLKDSSKSRGGMPDYLITFVKPGENVAHISHPKEPDLTEGLPDIDIPPHIDVQIEHLDPSQWTQEASSAFESIKARGDEIIRRRREWYASTQNAISLPQWQEWASPVWMTIDQSNTLNVKMAKDHADERHLCPLQLDVIERAIIMWSNPGDVVLSPFMGIGSEGVVALKTGRKFIGTELKESYFNQACRYLDERDRQGSLEL